MEGKVKAVRDWPTPTDTRQLKNVLGLASYYRRFVRGFSCVAAPLFRLLQKDKEFVWAAESIHSDQGGHFESCVFAALCIRLDMQKTRTIPLHPQIDGLVERFHRCMEQQLAIISAKHHRDWDTHLSLELMAYRSAVQESTSCTPALLMLGRELRTPAELAFGRPTRFPPCPPWPGVRQETPGPLGDGSLLHQEASAECRREAEKEL